MRLEGAVVVDCHGCQYGQNELERRSVEYEYGHFTNILY